MPGGATVASISRQITGVDKLLGRGAPASWLATDMRKWRAAVGHENFTYCGVECGAGVSTVVEEVKSAFAMATFDTGDRLPAPVRGDVGSYIQSISSLIPFNQLGLPESLLANSNTRPDELFTIGRQTNTPGGRLQGFEINGQLQFDFLPGFLSNTGALANYPRVKSKINYILASVNGVLSATTTADLVGLSRDSASGTLYYEDDKFSVRSTASYRGGFIRQIPSGGNDSDILGNGSTLFVDVSASYNINDQFKVLFEVQNITGERNKLYIDSVRRDSLFEMETGRTYTIGVTYRY